MTFICLICKESITAQSDYQIKSEKDTGENIVITTKCGHLYHKACLGQFFSYQKQDDEENGRRVSPTLCPKCKRVVILINTIQIYPEEDEDAYYTLLAKKNEISRENRKLKADIAELLSQVQLLKAALVNKKNDRKPTATCNLKEGDKIICFKDNSDELVSGTVLSIGQHCQTKLLQAEVSLETGETTLIPVAELILSSDYFDNTFSEIAIATTSDSVKDYDDQLNSSTARKNSQFNAKFNKTKNILKKLQDEVDAFTGEQIDGVEFYIKNQIAKAASFKRNLITLDSSIQDLREMGKEFNESGNNIDQLDIERKKALEVLRETSKLYNIALPQVQKIKSFIKAGFHWLEILETKVRSFTETEFTKEDAEKQFVLLDTEMQSRRFSIATITQAVEKFMAIPNSKLALKDHSLLLNTFSSFKSIETEFEIKKTTFSLQSVSVII